MMPPYDEQNDIGTVIAGYTLVRRLGTGSYGDTWQCEAPLGKQYRFAAVKFLDLSPVNAAVLTDVEHECTLLQKIKHPNVVQLLEYLPPTHSTPPGIVLEFLDGRSLQKHVEAQAGGVDKNDAIRWTIEAATGLLQMHTLGVLHRDVKPDNIVLDTSGIKIVDFGLAISLQSATGGGTADYRPPEQWDPSTPLEYSADIYSLGCVLYFLLTGKPPFPTRNIQTLRHRHECDPLPSTGNPDLDEIIVRATQKKPADRYKTMGELIADLQPYRKSGIIKIATPGNYWHPYWTSKLIDASIHVRESNEQRWQTELNVPSSVFASVRLGLQTAEVEFEKVISIAERLLQLPAPLCRLLLALPNDDPNKVLTILTSSKTPTGRHLIKKIEQEIECLSMRWLPKFLKQRQKHPYEGPMSAIHMRRINHIAALQIDDLPGGSAAAFELSEVIRTLAIERGPDNEDGASHLRFSNQQLAGFAADYFIQQASSVPEVLTLLEGGVGGAHSTYFLIHAITSACERARRPLPQLRYKGFELVGRFAWAANEILKGAYDETDKRSQLFAGLRRDRKLEPLNVVPGDEFVEFASMIDGFRQLRENAAIQRRLETVDACIISYALHHIPNGSAIRRYLSRPIFEGDFCCKTDRQKKRFSDELKHALKNFVHETDSGFVPQRRLPDGFYRPLRSLWASLDWSLIGLRQVFSEFVNFVNADFSKTFVFSGEWLLRIRNTQRELLYDVRDLLRPGGLLLIADPDGTSSFNWTRKSEDPEATIANFNSRDELVSLLSDIGLRFDVNLSETVVRDENRFHSTVDARVIGTVYGSEFEGNMGYHIVARKV